MKQGSVTLENVHSHRGLRYLNLEKMVPGTEGWSRARGWGGGARKDANSPRSAPFGTGEQKKGGGGMRNSQEDRLYLLGEVASLQAPRIGSLTTAGKRRKQLYKL